MCGIVGAVAERDVVAVLMEGLRRLEYRGYDSAGIAVINDAAGLVRVVLDRALLERDPLHFHPLDNAMTTTVSAEGLLRFLAATAHAPEVVDLDEFEVEAAT